MVRLLIVCALGLLACGDRRRPSTSEPAGGSGSDDARTLRLIRQETDQDCGPAAMTMTLSYYGRPATLSSIVRDMPTTDGVSALQIVELARARGLGATGVQLGDPDALRTYLARGDILHVDGSHFVVVDRVAQTELHVLDPARGPRVILIDRMSDELSGVALLFADGPEALRRRLATVSP